jgi:hypothetical protein
VPQVVPFQRGHFVGRVVVSRLHGGEVVEAVGPGGWRSGAVGGARSCGSRPWRTQVRVESVAAFGVVPAVAMDATEELSSCGWSGGRFG